MRASLLFLCVVSCAPLPQSFTPPKPALVIVGAKGGRVPDAEVNLPPPQRLEMQPRDAAGAYLLAPGYYVLDVPSFCLHPGRGGSSAQAEFVPTTFGGPSG